MTHYQIVGAICQSMIVIVPFFVLFVGKRSILEKAVLSLLCIGATFCYDFRLFGFSLSQILLTIIFMFGLLFKSGSAHKELKKNNDIEILKVSIFFYLTYITLVTLIGYCYRADYLVEGGIFQNQLRPVVQSVQVIFTYIAVVIIIRFNSEASISILRIFSNVLLVFAIIGILQTIIFAFTKFDILPMRKDFISEVNGISVTASNGLLRATAGIGEPKQYAKFMVLGFAIELLAPRVFGNEKVSWQKVVLFAVATYVSSSTTGYIMALVVLFIFFWKKFKHNKTYLLLGVLVLTIVTPLIFNSEVITEKVFGAETRGEIFGFEDADTATFNWLSNEPSYLITGTGISNTVAYANEYAPSSTDYINNYPYTLRRGIIKSLAEGGVIGFAFQLFIMYKLYNKIRRDTTIKYFGLFILFMHFFLTCEAIIEVQMILLALLYSINPLNKGGENNKNCTDQYCI